MADVRILEADLADPAHGADIVALIDAYARDRFGGGVPLSEEVRSRLHAGLAAHPTTRVWLAFAGDEAIGVAVVFEGYSTFAAAPLLNIHDLAVLEPHRGRGVGRLLLAAVEEAARKRGCAKLTLEVLAQNRHAQGLYESFGFQAHPVGEPDARTFQLAKKLSS